jgi:FixJ family two-component response regulator
MSEGTAKIRLLDVWRQVLSKVLIGAALLTVAIVVLTETVWLYVTPRDRELPSSPLYLVFIVAALLAASALPEAGAHWREWLEYARAVAVFLLVALLLWWWNPKLWNPKLPVWFHLSRETQKTVNIAFWTSVALAYPARRFWLRWRAAANLARLEREATMAEAAVRPVTTRAQAAIGIMVVHREQATLDFICGVLSATGYRCRTFPSGKEALAMLASGEEIGIALVDIRFHDDRHNPCLHEFLVGKYPTLAVVVFQDWPDVELAREMFQHGVHDCLVRPFESEELLTVVCSGLAYRDAIHQNPDQVASVVAQDQADRLKAIAEAERKYKAAQAASLEKGYQSIDLARAMEVLNAWKDLRTVIKCRGMNLANPNLKIEFDALVIAVSEEDVTLQLVGTDDLYLRSFSSCKFGLIEHLAQPIHDDKPSYSLTLHIAKPEHSSFFLSESTAESKSDVE